jgi:hypothetical protein
MTAARRRVPNRRASVTFSPLGVALDLLEQQQNKWEAAG